MMPDGEMLRIFSFGMILLSIQFFFCKVKHSSSTVISNCQPLISAVQWVNPLSIAYLQQLAFSRIWKGREHFFVLLHSKLGETRGGFLSSGSCWGCSVWTQAQCCAYFCIQHVYTEVTECRLEEVILGTVFQERAVHRVSSDLKPQAQFVFALFLWAMNRASNEASMKVIWKHRTVAYCDAISAPSVSSTLPNGPQVGTHSALIFDRSLSQLHLKIILINTHHLLYTLLK